MAQRIFILGAGRFGTHLASRLGEFGCEVVLADRDPKRVEDLAGDGFHAVEMDADDADDLKSAGVAEADAVVVAIGENMQASILATLLLKEIGVKKIIAHALDVKHATVLEKVGADIVVQPSRDMAHRLAERLQGAAFSDRFPVSGEYQIAHIRLGKALHGKTLGDARLSDEYRVNVILVNRTFNNEKSADMEPRIDLELAQNDLLFVVGKRSHITRFERDCGE